MVQLILQGILLSPPDTCPIKVCDLMCRCWKTKPCDRLNFSEILTLLEAIINNSDNLSYIGQSRNILNEYNNSNSQNTLDNSFTILSKDTSTLERLNRQNAYVNTISGMNQMDSNTAMNIINQNLSTSNISFTGPRIVQSQLETSSNKDFNSTSPDSASLNQSTNVGDSPQRALITYSEVFPQTETSFPVDGDDYLLPKSNNTSFTLRTNNGNFSTFLNSSNSFCAPNRTTSFSSPSANKTRESSFSTFNTAPGSFDRQRKLSAGSPSAIIETNFSTYPSTRKDLERNSLNNHENNNNNDQQFKEYITVLN